MCEFFSFVSDGKGNVFYFDAESRKALLKANPENYDPDSHTSIVHKFISKDPEADDRHNKYELIGGRMIIDVLNTNNDVDKVTLWAKKFYESSAFQKICSAAVTQNGWALEYVKKQTPEICLAANKSKLKG